MPELLELDPTSEDAANSPLSLMTSSYRVLAQAYPAPTLNVLYASSVDTEGELPASRRYSNRQISVSVEMVDASGALLRALQAKVAKIAREGGTLKRSLTTGQVIVFDLLTSDQFDPTFDVSYYSGSLVKVDLVFAAKPFGRGAPVTLSAHTEATLPCLVFTETGITGDVPALGKLVITEAQAIDQCFVMWGIQSRNYSNSADAALFYQAEGRTALQGSAIAVGATGASGAGSNVMRSSNLGPTYQAVVSTQAASAGNHLSHIGGYRVWARVLVPASNTGSVTIAWEWASGDFRTWTRNADVTIDPSRAGTWVMVNLGQVNIARVAQGTQRWEGRLVAKSTSGSDTIDTDCFYFVPVDEGYGEARSGIASPSPSSFLALDGFNQTAGALSAKTLQSGGAWTTVAIDAGGTTDFAVDATNHWLTRTDVTGGSRRRAAHNGTNYASVVVQCDIQTNSVSPFTYAAGIMARFVDANNYVLIAPSSSGIVMYGFVAGVQTLGGGVTLSGYTPGDWVTVQATIEAAGRWKIMAGHQGGPLTSTAFGQSPILATGGVLATGKAGIIDSTATVVRNWDNFRVWAPSSDAAVFASQSLEVRHDQVIREDSGGTVWQPVSKYEGSYLRIPPAGAEARALRVFAKASRNDPDIGGDDGVDDITAQVTYTPRFLVIP